MHLVRDVRNIFEPLSGPPFRCGLLHSREVGEEPVRQLLQIAFVASVVPPCLAGRRLTGRFGPCGALAQRIFGQLQEQIERMDAQKGCRQETVDVHGAGDLQIRQPDRVVSVEVRLRAVFAIRRRAFEFERLFGTIADPLHQHFDDVPFGVEPAVAAEIRSIPPQDA